MEQRAMPPAPSPAAEEDNADKSVVTPTTTTTRPTSRYVRDFESLFVPIRVELLRSKAQTGQLRHCQFRSLCWRYFLNCLPENYDDWLSACELKRRQYETLKRKNLATMKPDGYLVGDGKESSDQSKDIKTDYHNQQQTHGQNKDAPPPPSEDKKTPTNNRPENSKQSKNYNDTQSGNVKTINCDHKNVFRTIERDVIRTFPDMEFFRQAEMQDILCNILFNFASENQHLSYKQGMHELLATLLYVAHTDSQNCLINYEGDLANETIASLLSLKYLEHDVYHLFSSLMKSIETWYQNDEILVVPETGIAGNQLGSHNELIGKASQASASGSSSSSSNWSSPKSRPRTNSTKQQVSSVLGIKLKKISENIVKSYDTELFNHLEALQIAPQIYGIRWMRLLFGREFEFLDLLMVWDAIICDQDPMSLIDYVFASMLITIREELVNGDYTHCLNNLMRYQFKNVPYVIKLALYLRDPVNHSRPKEYSQYRTRFDAANAKMVSKSHRALARHNTPTTKKPIIKEFEMREMQSAAASSMPNNVPRSSGNQKSRFPMSRIGTSSSRNAFDVSSESYDDLHSIVDYCWRLLSEQIDSLQRCLPKEKGLHSEDEIFVALAQLKKVRDVLKGSLKLEDELESAALILGGNKN
uniref:TBC1 domain family member 5 n=1 Tax=Aceria tosichella TaxID=561515 RepID=A0A6G1SQX5_9ACAR